jgi:hypothetical protein
VAVAAWAGRHAFLYQDDYVFLTQAREQDFGLDYLRGDLFGHFSPLSRLVNAAAVDALPEHLWMVRGLLLGLGACYAAAVVLLAVTALGRTRLGLVAAFSMATSLAVLSLANWWTAGLNILPAVAASAVCLTALVRVVSGGSARWGVLALASYVVAVLDYESTLLVAGYAFLWVLLFARQASGAGPLSVLRRSWWLWVAFGVVGALALVNYRVSYYDPTPRPTTGDTLSALARSLLEVQLPLLLGFSDPAQGQRMRVGTVVAVVAVAVLLVVLARRGAGARGLVFAVAGWALPSAALVLSRVGLYGEGMVHQPYYYALSTVLVVLGLGMALSAPAATVRRQAPWLRTATPVALVLLGLVAGTAWVLSAGAASRAVWADPGDTAPPEGDGPYVDRLRRTAAALGPDATLIDGDVPGVVVLANFAPYNRLHVVAALNGVEVPFGRVDRTPYAATQAGSLVPVSIQWLQRLDIAGGAPPGLAVSGTDGPVRPGPGGACFSTTAATRLEWALPEPVRGRHLLVRADFAVPSGTPARAVVTETGRSWVPANNDGTVWAAGAAGVLDTVAVGRVARVGYDSFAPGREVCLSGLAVGVWSVR